MSNQPPKRANDSAAGPLSGYLFQFEKALLLLVDLENSTDYISIEEVDDVSTHSADGTVVLTIQAKHCIANSGSPFGDTSIALWRTLEIWIDKLQKGIFDDQTKFQCATNKQISNTSLLYKIANQPFEKAFAEVQQILKIEKAKLKDALKANPNAGNSIREIIRLIKFVIRKKNFFETIQKHLFIADGESVMEKFLNKLHMGSEQVTEIQKNRTYEEFYGWIINHSKARWMNGKEARFTKKSFDSKWYHIRTNPAIIAAIFRTKESLGSISEHEILLKKKELFVRQIEDIKRNKEAKARIIREAILNFLYTDIEIKHVVDKGDYTDEDFEEFMNQCQQIWQSTYDTKVIREMNEYNDDEKK